VSDRTRTLEDEYFDRIDREAKDRIRHQIESEEAVRKREELKQLHLHHCGKCGGTLEARAFRGLEIDVCVDCGATLLDRGELETLAGHDHAGLFSGLAELFRRP
jgi:hypothetical protein